MREQLKEIFKNRILENIGITTLKNRREEISQFFKQQQYNKLFKTSTIE